MYCCNICHLDDICLDCHEYHLANTTNIKTNALYCNCCKNHLDFDDGYDLITAIRYNHNTKKFFYALSFRSLFSGRKKK